MEENIAPVTFAGLSKKQFLILILAIVAIVLLTLVAVSFYQDFVSNRQKSYLIENKYYGFKLNTQGNWLAEENTFFSEEKITQIMEDCKNNASASNSVYKVGAFRFKDQKYPQDFGFGENSSLSLPSGAIFEVTVNCVPNNIKKDIENYFSGNLKVAGERASEAFLNLSEFGKTKYLSFFHKGLQYKIGEYVYVSPGDNEEKIREKYAEIFNKIIGSLEFTN